MTPVVQKLTAEDVKVAKAFKNIVLQGKFEIKGDAVRMAGSLFAWFDNLDLRIAETIKPEPPETIRKDLGAEEIKKKGK